MRADGDPTAAAHEVGHLMGLTHPGDPNRAVPVNGQPGIMSTIFNSVEGQYSIDGKPTKWVYKDGKPHKPSEGKLDISKRKTLPSEVKQIPVGMNKINALGKSYVTGINH